MATNSACCNVAHNYSAIRSASGVRMKAECKLSDKELAYIRVLQAAGYFEMVEALRAISETIAPEGSHAAIMKQIADRALAKVGL